MDFDFIEEEAEQGAQNIWNGMAVWITGYFSVVVFGNSSITSKIKFKRLKKEGIINPLFLFTSFSFVFFK